jgi:multidrug efflux pump subunit AcrB
VYREGDRADPDHLARAERRAAGAEQLDNVQVYSPTAQRYLPVAQLVTGVEVEWVDAIIRRVDRFPTIKAQADPLPGELAGAAAGAAAAAGRGHRAAAGYALEWHGEYKASREANAGSRGPRLTASPR